MATRLLVPAFGGVYRAFAPFTEPLIRLCAGLCLAVHGYTILFGDHEKFADFFENAGFEPGMFWALTAGAVQLFCGLAFAAGFLTRLAAVPILVFLLVAMKYHFQFGFYWDTRGYEYPLFWAIVTCHFLVHGGGRYSVDAAMGREI